MQRISDYPSVCRFADEVALEGGGHMLRLLPLLAPSSPSLVPVGLMPLSHPPQPRSEGTISGRALTEKLLQLARNKSAPPPHPFSFAPLLPVHAHCECRLRRRVAAPINITTHCLKLDRKPYVDRCAALPTFCRVFTLFSALCRRC
jgi:hypothetical protein